MDIESKTTRQTGAVKHEQMIQLINYVVYYL